MRAWLFLLVLLMVPAVLASQEVEDLFARDIIGVDVLVSSDLTLQPTNTKPLDVEYVQADLYFFPKEDTAQRVTSLTTEPEAERTDGALRYRWEQPGRTNLRATARSSVEVRNVFPRVLKKIPFPLKSVPAEARQYLEPTEHIDSLNPAVFTMANKLASGKDDLFVVVSDIAIWTKNNIAYNLSTLTAEVSQKASWVLQNKYGVCDELTSLFIAMLRALGIPARFVTGVSYTSSPLFPERWGAHGWAEVYFPDVGWVPFDPTFGEFGWVDPGHVKMLVAADPGSPSVRFEWRSANAQLQFSEPDVDASITKVGTRLPPIVELSVKPIYAEVGFGSHNLVQATVSNLQPYYVTAEVRLARVNELEVLEPHDRQVVLKPREEKTLFWRVKVADSLDKRFLYTIPLGAYTVRNDSATGSFVARVTGAEHAKVDVTRVMNRLSEDEEQVVSHTLDMDCVPDKNVLYEDEQAKIACTLRNVGTTPLKSVRVCVEDAQCSALDVGIGQVRELDFTQAFTEPGTQALFVRATSADLSRSVPLSFQMVDTPAVNVSELSYPATVAYGATFSLVFVLSPVSYSTPKNVQVAVRAPAGGRVFEIPALSAEQALEAEFGADELGLGTTDIVIDVQFEDDRGRTYRTSATAPVTLTDVPFLPKLWLWFRGWFE